MDDFGSERPKTWNIYTSSDPSPSETGGIDQETPWKSFGTSMDAISFGFVATVILISLFLIMAIFEHLFRSSSSLEDVNDGSLESGSVPNKTGHALQVPSSHASDFSVVMPGQKYPTYIAQPAPLPCSREGIYWPSHEHNFVVP